MTESHTTSIASSLEALLYSQGGELEIKKVLSALQIDKDELGLILKEYNSLGRGLSIVADDKLVAIKVSQSQAALISDYAGKSTQEGLSKASLEVLSVVLYKGAATASEVDYVRGVNSTYTLRQLSVRGLLLKLRQGMGHVYKPSVELLSILGITDLSALPARDDILKQLNDFELQADITDQQDDREAN